MTTDSVDPLLALPGIDPAHLGREALSALGGRVSTAQPDEFILAVARAPGLSWSDGRDRPVTFLEIHDRRDWWLDLDRSGNREYLLSVLVAAALVDALKLEFTLDWTAGVLRAVIDVESATTDEAGVHLVLRRISGAALPDDLADEIHPLDFADFVTAVATAAPTIALPRGGSISFVNY
jgi:hypothetical protein